MTTFVALLRGVNVGGAKRVPMASFRLMLTGLGYSNVVTLLNSGNAVFSSIQGASKGHAAAIAKCIADELGLQVPVVVKSAEELAAIVDENPLTGLGLNPSRILVAFAEDKAALKALAAVGAHAKAPDRFHLGSHAAYAYCAEGSLISPVGAALLGRQRNAVTTRNWATTLKLHALAGAA